MSKVTDKYQITIPPGVRKELGVVPGSEVVISKQGDKFMLVIDPINELKKRWQGRFKSNKTTDEYMVEIRGQVW